MFSCREIRQPGTAWWFKLMSALRQSQVSKFMLAPDRFHMRTELYTLLRCATCSCVWVTIAPPPEEMANHYDEDYHRAIAAAGEGSAALRWRGQREAIAKHKSGGSILDIGCSSGGFLRRGRAVGRDRPGDLVPGLAALEVREGGVGLRLGGVLLGSGRLGGAGVGLGLDLDDPGVSRLGQRWPR